MLMGSPENAINVKLAPEKLNLIEYNIVQATPIYLETQVLLSVFYTPPT